MQAGGPEKLPPLQQKRAGVSWGQEEAILVSSLPSGGSVLCCQVIRPGAPQLGLAVSVYLLHSAVVPVLVWGDCQKFIFFSSPFSPDCQTGRALTPDGPSHKDSF